MNLTAGWKINETVLEELFEEDVPKDGKILEQQLYDFDLRDFGLPTLGGVSKECTCVQGPLVLQLTRFRNVSQPKINEHGNRDGICRLFLTDGHNSVSALIIDDVRGLNADTPPGTKVLLKGSIPMEQNFLLLNNNNTLVLGGHVDHLVDKWKMEKSAIRESTRKGETGAPKWISFSKKGAEQALAKLQSKNFKASDFLQTAVKKEVNEDDKFEQQRKEILESIDDGTTKKFAAPTIQHASIPQPVEREPKKAVVSSDRGHDRRAKGRKGRRESDDDGPVPAEFARPSGPSTLFDFMAGSTLPGLPAADENRPAHDNRRLNENNDHHTGSRGGRGGGRGGRGGARGGFNNERSDRNAPPSRHQDDRGPSTRGGNRGRGGAPRGGTGAGPSRDSRGGRAPNQRTYNNDDYQPRQQQQQQHNRGPENRPSGTKGQSNRNNQGSNNVDIDFRNPHMQLQNQQPRGGNRDQNPRHQHQNQEGGQRNNSTRPQNDNRNKQQQQQHYQDNRQQQQRQTFNRDMDNSIQQMSNMNIGGGSRTFYNSQRSQQTSVLPTELSSYHANNWKVGQTCMAPYSDGQFYLATIVNLNPITNMCSVRFNDYGNMGTLPTAVLLTL